MPILGLRILPPLAIARFGSSPYPLDAFTIEVSPQAPLGYREIVPAETLEIDASSGAVRRKHTPNNIRFRDDEDRIRPVAPFLEVYAQTSAEALEPLTLELLEREQLGASDVYWTVQVGNLKVYRQTGKESDRVLATCPSFNDHEIHNLEGRCDNFLPGKFIPFGYVRYICPTKPEHSQIRLRFTPGHGKVYGASLKRFVDDKTEVDDPVFNHDDARIVYDIARGTWRGFQSDLKSNTLTNPSDIYQGYISDPRKLAKSWGYLDDVCDGPVSVELRLKNGSVLSARAWVSACMPAFAPDSQPVRTVADELEQLILGPDVPDEEVSVQAAAEIVRRAFETVRFMNTMAMNGNTIGGRTNIAHTLGTQDTNDYGRLYAPIVASSLVDNLAVRALHERVLTALASGSAPWFSEVLRRPEDIGDMSDKERRKMPAMLRGADGRALALTRRQISKIVKAATKDLFGTSA
jgi:hypothetical protein